MARHAFLATDRLDVSWDALGDRIAAEITRLRRGRARYVVERHRPTWSIRLRRDGDVLTAVVGSVGAQPLPLVVQGALLDLGWGMRGHISSRAEFAVSWIPEDSPTTRLPLLRNRARWVSPDDLADARELVLSTLRGPFATVVADAITIR